MQSIRKNKFLWGSVAGVLGIGIAIIWALAAQSHGYATAKADPDPGGPILVKTVRPRLNPQGFERSVTQPAYLRAFYKADLMARVPGAVKFIKKNIGDPVKEGEVLVELDVPDLVQDVVQKEALVKQAEQDAHAVEAYVPVARATEKAMRALVAQRRTEVAQAAATMKYRQAEYARYKMLAANNAVVASVVDERLRDAEAAEASWKAAQVAVEVARANYEEFSAKSAAALVDVDVKKSRVRVAEAARQSAQAMLDYAKVRAPFDGQIVARHVDPGAFVQNASTGHPTPVLTVVRTDIMTAVMWVPEKDAAYVGPETDAVLRFDALRNQEIRAKVTRAANALDPDKGRDMRVEVDLYNAPQNNYRKALAQDIGRFLAPLAASRARGAAALLAASTTPGSRRGPLRPGMYGTMKLVLQRFENAYLVPTCAVFERAGQSCIFEVKDGRAHLVPVRLQLEDGMQAKVMKLVTQLNPAAGHREEIEQELTANDDIIRCGQGEIVDGQAVKCTASDW
jgi:HlyD family secretion protein